jgi:hypothetical protein
MFRVLPPVPLRVPTQLYIKNAIDEFKFLQSSNLAVKLLPLRKNLVAAIS